MGNGTSSQQKIVNDAVNESITNVVTNQTSTTDIAISANNTMLDITFGPRSKLIDCTFNASQKTTSLSDIHSMTKFTNLTDLQDTIEAALSAKITGENNAEQGAFATALNVSVDKSEMDNSLHNIVQKNITSNTFNDFNSAADAVNSKANFVFNGKCNGSTIDISQSIFQQQQVELLTHDLTKTTGKSDEKGGEGGDSSHKNDTKQQGGLDALGNFVKSIGDAIGNIMKGPVLVICITIVIIAILAFIFRKSISKIAEKKTGVSFGRKIEKLINTIKKM